LEIEIPVRLLIQYEASFSIYIADRDRFRHELAKSKKAQSGDFEQGVPCPRAGNDDCLNTVFKGFDTRAARELAPQRLNRNRANCPSSTL